MATSVLNKKAGDPSASAWIGREKGAALSRFGGGRRRSVPHLLAGVLLIAACAGGGVLMVSRWGDRESVLALSHPVAVGQVLTAQQLTEVSMAFDSAMDLIPATAASTVVGKPAAFSLPAGSLVTRAVLGSPQNPPIGKAIAALGLKPGQFPPDLSPGTTVVVLTASVVQPGSATEARTLSWTAAVTGLTASENDQTTVVSLQMLEADARAMASAPAGQLSLVAVAGGER